MKNINENENEEMNAHQLTEMYNEVIAKHEEAKMAYKNLEKAKTTKEKSKWQAVLDKHPHYEHGHMPMTPAREAFETFKHQYKTYFDLSEVKLIRECERIILLSPDAAEYSFHVARLRQAPWAEAEHRIAESPMWAYMYSRMVLKEAFTAGEDAIHSNEKYSERYTRFLS